MLNVELNIKKLFKFISLIFLNLKIKTQNF